MISILAMYERSYCDCEKCTQCCRSKPGCTAPSDIDRIAAYDGHETWDSEYLLSHFEACQDGPRTATEAFPDGKSPAIRPKRKEDGSCIFLTSEGKCSIHPVAPFECQMVNACDPVAGAAAMKALGKAIAKSADYCQTHFFMWQKQEKANS